jgi:hypothetical protein
VGHPGQGQHEIPGGVKNHTKPHENIIKDQIIALKGKHKGMNLRRVEARVEVDGKWRVMVFITNNSPGVRAPCATSIKSPKGMSAEFSTDYSDFN